MRNKLLDGRINSTLLLYAGRLGIEKNIRYLKKVLNQNSNLSLALVGVGPDEKYLKDYFMNSNVYFAGQLHGFDVVSVSYFILYRRRIKSSIRLR